MKHTLILLTGLCLPLVSQAADKEEGNLNQHDAAVGLAFDQGLSAVLEVDNTYRLSLGNDGLAADYLFKRGQFENPDVPVDWYVGAGAWTNWEDNDDDLGLRMPVGVDWNYKSRVHVYGELQPELVVHDELKLGLGASVGVTYHF